MHMNECFEQQYFKTKKNNPLKISGQSLFRTLCVVILKQMSP